MYTILMWQLKNWHCFVCKQPADARDRGGRLHLGVRAILHLLPFLGQSLDLAALFSWDRPRLLLVPSRWARYVSFRLDALSVTCWVHLFFFPAGYISFSFFFLLLGDLFVCCCFLGGSFLLVHNSKDYKNSLKSKFLSMQNDHRND